MRTFMLPLVAGSPGIRCRIGIHGIEEFQFLRDGDVLQALCRRSSAGGKSIGADIAFRDSRALVEMGMAFLTWKLKYD